MDLYQLVVFALFTTADVAIFAKICHAAYRSALLSRCLTTAARGIVAARALVPVVGRGRNYAVSCEDADDEKSAEERVVRDHITRTLSERCVWFARVVNTAVAISLLGTRLALYRAPAESPLWWKGSVIAYGMQTIVVPLGLWFPKSINERTLTFWHVMFMLSISLAISPWGTDFETGVLHLRPMLHMLATALLFGCPCMSALLVTNTIFGASSVWLYASADQADAQVPLADFVRGEVIILLGKALVHWRVTQFAKSAAEQDIRSRTGQCQRSAVTSLLGMMCDAVVDLDAGLRMKAHEASLANLLMHGSGKLLRRERLVQFVAPGADRDRFEERIAANSGSGTPMAGMFTGRIRDAIGNSIGVVFYHVPYATITGAVHHLLGIRENTEGSDAPRCCGFAAHGRAAMPEAVLADGVGEYLRPVPSAPDQVSQSSQSSAASSCSVPGERTLTVDVWVREGLLVQQATEKAQSKFGLPAESGNFLDILGRCEDGAALAEWIRERIADTAAPRPRIELYGDITFRNAAGRIEGGCRTVRVCFPGHSATDSVSLNVGALSRAPGSSRRRGTPAGHTPRGSLRTSGSDPLPETVGRIRL